MGRRSLVFLICDVTLQKQDSTCHILTQKLDDPCYGFMVAYLGLHSKYFNISPLHSSDLASITVLSNWSLLLVLHII